MSAVAQVRPKNDITPLAQWARLLEIIIPIYMLGKSWGAADEKNLALFRAMFPPVLINATEYVKRIFYIDNVPLQYFIATTSGALMSAVVVIVFAFVIHFILADRKFVDSLRFTAVTIVPVAVMNGLLSHGVQMLVNQMASQPLRNLEFVVVYLPWVYFFLNFAFYMTALWVMGRRTGVVVARRRWLLAAGTCFTALYLAAGLMILPSEWNALLAQLP